MRINILWLVPLIVPFALVVMVRLLWAVTGLPWEPSEDGAGFLVTMAMIISFCSAACVALMQSEGVAVWWNIRRKQ